MRQAGAVLTVDRQQVIAHRIAVGGLHRDGRGLDRVLRLGVQVTGTSAPVALAARQEPGSSDAVDLTALTTAWTHRGAPHHHRPAQLVGLARASLPLSDADAAARLNWSGPEQRRIGIPAAEAIARASDALSEVVTAPTTKGQASAEVTRRLPDTLLRDCRPCGAVHVNEQLMRLSALAVGVGVDPSERTLLLTPPPDGWERPAASDPARAAELVDAYLAVLGPAGRAEAAGFVGSSPAAFAPAWESAVGSLVEVSVAGASAWLPAADADALADPPEPDVVRLLPPSDSFLQLRDRALLVPDAERRAALYRTLGNPGAVLADGEIAGTWRAAASGRKVTITVTAFDPLPPTLRAAVEEEAERVAAARGSVLQRVAVAS